MKNKVTIKNTQGDYLQHVIFEDQQTQDDFIQMLHNTHAWGKPEHEVELLNEEGLSFDPKQFETIPSEYTIEIEDLTQQIEQDRINLEAEEYLKSTDFYVIRFMETGVQMPSGMSEERQAARERIIR